MNDSQTHRPVTSKARGICKYYTTPRGCFAAKSCKFLHTSDPVLSADAESSPTLTPYDRAKRCRFYAQGYCKRGEKCWFLHVDSDTPATASGSSQDGDEEQDFCSICFEKPSIYGLLGGCSHIFCIKCIRQWRDSVGKTGDVVGSGNTKKCPMCRASSQYIIPSSKFWKEGEGKESAILKYKESMARVPCKHFIESKAKRPSRPSCPFGKDCFYKHLNDDGSTHVFKDGAEASMRSSRRRVHPFDFGSFGVRGISLSGPFQEEFYVPPAGFDSAGNLADSIARDMFDRMVSEVTLGIANVGAGRGGQRRANGRNGGRGGGRAPTGIRADEVDETTLGRARQHMLAGAMTAIRAELERLEGTQLNRDGAGAGLRPVVVQETLSPSDWDLEAGVDETTDNGWGWNEFLSDAGADGDANVMERLELLADHLLGSLNHVGVQDAGTPSPALEPIGRGVTPPPQPPPEPDVDSDTMPGLEDVSDSSDEEQDTESGSEDDGDLRHQEAETAIRPFDLAFNEPPQSGDGTGWSRFQSMFNLPPEMYMNSRFSTVVGREEQRMVIDVDEDEAAAGEDPGEQADGEDDSEEVAVAVEPSFVTDGRGRVVWSNKETGPTEPLVVETEAEGSEGSSSTEDASASRSLLGRMFDALF